MTIATIAKLAGIYLALILITFGFIQRERASQENATPGGTGKSLFWALLWPVYWLAVVGPKTSLNHLGKFLSHNTGFWAVYVLGIPASFAVLLYVRWDDGLLFSQGAWLIFKSLCMALTWPVFLFV